MSSETERRHRFESIAAEVFEPLQRYLRRRAPADDAADIFGDVLLVLWRRLDDVPENPLPWCYGVARRTLANHRRSAQRHLRLVQRLEVEPQPTAADDPAGGADDPDLEEALSQLPPGDQELLRLWAWEQLEPREIAEVLDTSPNAVSLRLTRARKKLAAALARQDSSNDGHEGDRHAEEQRR